jgi:CheY-like chemotaxis protein
VARERILIVEDNETNMELAADLLDSVGYEVLQAEDAERALILARVELPALILMDLRLPGLDGLTAARMLKQEEATQAIPVVALTAHAMKGDQERALAAGCIGYITKPIDTRAFPHAIASFIHVAMADPPGREGEPENDHLYCGRARGPSGPGASCR